MEGSRTSDITGEPHAQRATDWHVAPARAHGSLGDPPSANPGDERCLHFGKRSQVRLIVLEPGTGIALQQHHHRAEHWIVIEGTARVMRGGEEMVLSEAQSIFIPAGTRHRLQNPGRIPLHLIEVQYGSYLGDDDIVRVEE